MSESEDGARRHLDERGWGTGGVSDSASAMNVVHEVAGEARTSGDQLNAHDLLAALVVLRHLRDDLTEWEPELIGAARRLGASWTELAPALGVASRQAAERRYLRLRPSPEGHSTGEERVRAERDRRAGDRAVSQWARENAAALRGLAGQGASSDVGQQHVDDLNDALGADDPVALLSPLAAAQPHLMHTRPELAGQIAAMTEHADELRRKRR
jgi:hypothetical protein